MLVAFSLCLWATSRAACAALLLVACVCVRCFHDCLPCVHKPSRASHFRLVSDCYVLTAFALVDACALLRTAAT